MYEMRTHGRALKDNQPLFVCRHLDDGVDDLYAALCLSSNDGPIFLLWKIRSTIGNCKRE